MRRRSIAVVAAGLAATAALAACGSGSSSSPSGGGSTATLVQETTPTGPLTRNFNPFFPTSAATTIGSNAYINEPLLQFNFVNPGQVYPWLATKYVWSNGGKSITFTIRQGVKWTDGKPFTAADVAFTYNLVKNNKAINTSGLPLTNVTSSGDTVTLSFSSAQYANLFRIAGVYIVPQHIWASVGNPATYTDPNPVGTGPFMLKTFSPQGVTMTRNPNYWQKGLPKVNTVEFPVYTGNQGVDSALSTGSLTWAGSFITNLQQIYVSKDPAHNKFYQPPLNTVTLEPNLAKAPFNDLKVRQAVSAAIDREEVSKNGESGQEPPATSATGLVLPTDKAYLTGNLAQYTLSTTADAAKAESILQSDGYTKDSKGYYAKGGKELDITIIDPTDYTDYAADDQIIATNLKAAGINASFQGESVAAWTTDVNEGNFDMTLRYSDQGPTPFTQLNGWLNSSATAPIGQAATDDFERFNSASVDQALATYAGTNDATEQKQAIATVAQAVATQLPVIPVCYGIAFAQYSTKNYTGWPNASNPYEIAQPSSPTKEVVVLRLRPTS